MNPYRTTRSHIVAGVLALLLGTTGMHKFYLGYFNTGFAMLGVSIVGGLLSFGVATAVVGLIGAIEGIIYLTMPQPAFDETYVIGKKEWF